MQEKTWVMNKIALIYLLLILYQPLSAQLFVGGSGDGFSIDKLSQDDRSFYVGGSEDGFTCDKLAQDDRSFFVGGIGDGFDNEVFIQEALAFFKGGVGDGFDCRFLIIDDLITTCSNVQNSWVGGNGDWTTASNWSAGIVPDLCHDVTISSPFAVTIPSGTSAKAKTLALAGQLSLLSGGSLLIDGRDTISTILQISGGRFINAGILNIENFASASISRSGIRLVSQGEFINENEVIIDSIGQNTSYGIQIASGTFRNEAGGSLFIKNGILATGYGIRNTDSLLNLGNILIQDFQGLGSILNQNHLNNSGLLQFTNVRGGMLNQDSIFNDGQINIQNITEFNGWRNSRADSYLKNGAMGQILMDNISMNFGLDNIGRIDNMGEITILNAPLGALKDIGGEWNNMNRIHIFCDLSFGLDLDNTSFTNYNLLEITDGTPFTDDALILRNGTILMNKAEVRIIH